MAPRRPRRLANPRVTFAVAREGVPDKVHLLLIYEDGARMGCRSMLFEFWDVIFHTETLPTQPTLENLCGLCLLNVVRIAADRPH